MMLSATSRHLRIFTQSFFKLQSINFSHQIHGASFESKLPSSVSSNFVNKVPLNVFSPQLTLNTGSNNTTHIYLPNALKYLDINYSLPEMNRSSSKMEMNFPSLNSLLEKLDPTPTKEIQDPISHQIVTKYCGIRMMLIRKKKMKKHQLKKLRKSMKFAWAKDRQKRNWKKESQFQKGLLDQIKDAEKFNAELWVKETLRASKMKPFVESREERLKRLKELRDKYNKRVWL